MGQSGHRDMSPNMWMGDTITSVPHYFRSQIKSGRLLVDFTAFFHQNMYFTLMLTKKLQLLVTSPFDLLPGLWTLDPAGGLVSQTPCYVPQL